MDEKTQWGWPVATMALLVVSGFMYVKLLQSNDLSDAYKYMYENQKAQCTPVDDWAPEALDHDVKG